jgi:hypothetical protein
MQLTLVTPAPAVPQCVIAVDWSGARDPRRTLWLAEHTSAGIVALESGFTHAAIHERLVSVVSRHRAAGTSVAIGLDFAFGFPSVFAERHRLHAIDDVWAQAEREGDAWLRCDVPPFWGRAGMRATRADGWGGARATDAMVRTLGLGHPKSPYQVTGAGAVGSSSIRGMSVLRALRAAGAAIWPFDAPGQITVMELYPRVATGAVVKRDKAAREAWLAQHAPELSSTHAVTASVSEDAFDAVAAARFLWQHRADVTHTAAPDDPRIPLEGAIWVPSTVTRVAG